MPADWNVVLLYAPGSIARPSLVEVVSIGRRCGFDVSGPLWDVINVMGADGLSSLLFESAEGALTWLAAHDGLLPMWHADLGFELDVSIHRVAGILPVEMEVTADTPLFDECRLSLLLSALEGRRRRAVWRAVEGFAAAMGKRTDARFVYMLAEYAQEALLPGWCVHRRVALGRLPSALPWLAMAPTDSPVAADLSKAAAVVRRRVDRAGGWTSLRLSPLPWQTTTEDLLHASAAWAEANRQAG
jgi:hypothetical protein